MMVGLWETIPCKLKATSFYRYVRYIRWIFCLNVSLSEDNHWNHQVWDGWGSTFKWGFWITLICNKCCNATLFVSKYHYIRHHKRHYLCECMWMCVVWCYEICKWSKKQMSWRPPTNLWVVVIQIVNEAGSELSWWQRSFPTVTCASKTIWVWLILV